MEISSELVEVFLASGTSFFFFGVADIIRSWIMGSNEKH